MGFYLKSCFFPHPFFSPFFSFLFFLSSPFSVPTLSHKMATFPTALILFLTICAMSLFASASPIFGGGNMEESESPCYEGAQEAVQSGEVEWTGSHYACVSGNGGTGCSNGDFTYDCQKKESRQSITVEEELAEERANWVKDFNEKGCADKPDICSCESGLCGVCNNSCKECAFCPICKEKIATRTSENVGSSSCSD